MNTDRKKMAKARGEPTCAQSIEPFARPIPFFSCLCPPAFIRVAFLLLFFLLAPSPALAHPPLATVASLKISAEGELKLTILHDSLAFALDDTSAAIGDDAMYALLHGPDDDLAAAFQDGRERMASQLKITIDGAPLPFNLTQTPTIEQARRWQTENPSERLPLKLDFVAEAKLPPGGRSLVFNFPKMLGQVVMTVHRPGVEPVAFPVEIGESSPPIDVGAATGSTEPAAPPMSALDVAWRFVKLGFNHIIPDGPDHCLFVLGLFLLIPRFKPVLWQISAFTVAHTVTLTLTSLHIIGLSSRIIEPTIAASIAFIGIENLVTTKISPWRPAVAFLFGLVHGMGVATAFNEAGFPPGQLVTSLAAFTVGVEAGHLAVLAVAFLTLSWFRDKPWYRTRIAIPLSLCIAAIALFWVFQRIFLA